LWWDLYVLFYLVIQVGDPRDVEKRKKVELWGDMEDVDSHL